jgi:hypothetical protein
MIQRRRYINVRHPHREQVDHKLGIERLEHIAREQRVVYAGILVLLQVRQATLADENHLGRFVRVFRFFGVCEEGRKSSRCFKKSEGSDVVSCS